MLKLIAGSPLAALAALASRRAPARRTGPNRPVTLVVPYAAGGPVDTIARIIAARMSEILGQQMVIENVGGAGGLTGTARVAKAAPDGYTVLLSGSAVLAQNPTLLQATALRSGRRLRPRRAVLGFGARADRAQGFPGRTTSRSSSPTRRRTRTSCNTARPARARAAHTCAILLDGAMGAKITHVPYRGAGPAMQDLLGGRIDYMLEQISTATPQIKGGTVKAYATLGLDRAPGPREHPDRGRARHEGPRLRRLGRVLVPEGHAAGDRASGSPRRPATPSTRRR